MLGLRQLKEAGSVPTPLKASHSPASSLSTAEILVVDWLEQVEKLSGSEANKSYRHLLSLQSLA